MKMDVVSPPPGSLSIGEEFRRSWKPMVAVVLGICFGSVPAYSLGAFIQPLSAEFGWTVTQITGWMLCWSLGAIASAPVAGYLADRVGAKGVALVSLLVLAGILAATGFTVETLTHYYLSGFAIGAIVSGTSAITYGRIVSSLFSRGLGTALGIMSTGIGASAIIGPRFMQAIIDAYDWRTALFVQAAFPLLILPLLGLWLREGHRDQMIANRAPKGEGYALGRALHMPVFWVMSLGSLLYGICVGGVSVNLMPFLATEGIGRAEAASAVGLFGLATVTGRFLTGIIIDRVNIHASVLMAIVLAAEALSFVILGYGGGGAALLIALPVFGFAVGAEADCLAYCTVRIFGRRYYGSIFGIVGIVMLYIGTGIGPVLFSLSQERLGGYQAAFAIWTGLALLAVPLFLWVARVPFFVAADDGR